MTPEREIRDTVQGLELRAAKPTVRSPGTMVGYAAVFDSDSCDLGMFKERLAPGCFARALKKSDVRALFNHDPNCLLGRSSAGTLRMTEDETGLLVEIDLPDTNLGRDIAESLRRGDIQGQSFSFTTATAGESWDTRSEPMVRTITEVSELFDVGPVAFPAYAETSAALRSYRAQQAAAKGPEPEPAPQSSAPDPRVIDSDRDSARLRLAEIS